jgi:hypothetical protein
MLRGVAAPAATHHRDKNLSGSCAINCTAGQHRTITINYHRIRGPLSSLVNAPSSVSRVRIRSDSLKRILKKIEFRVTSEVFGLIWFNDLRESYNEVRTILLAAREIARAKIEGRGGEEEQVALSAPANTASG